MRDLRKLFVDRHVSIQQQQSSLDWARNEFCRDLRAEFSAGADGDEKFKEWCRRNLEGVDARCARDYLLRSSIGVVFKSDRELRAAGGIGAAYLLIDSPSAQQVKAFRKAVAQKANIRALVNPTGDRPTLRPRSRLKDGHLKALAEFVLSSKDATARLREIAALYAQAPAPMPLTARRFARNYKM